MTYYRLRQPLFAYPEIAKENLRASRSKVIAYDVIYNLLFKPEGMQEIDIQENAKAALEILGNSIEVTLGESVFEVPETSQTEFAFMKEDENGKL